MTGPSSSQQALEAEVARCAEARCRVQDSQGRRLVIENGQTPERTPQTGLGDIPGKRARGRGLRDLVLWGPKRGPEVAIGTGALGFRRALPGA